MTEEERIAQLTEGMRFERKPAVTAREKKTYAALEADCDEAVKALRKLRLRLWHAAQGDYRSLPMEEARALLEEVKEKTDAALQKCLREEKK